MRRRIKSVKNTQQITKAMKMVAAAKLKRAQDRVTASRPFAAKMSEVLGGLSGKVAGEISHPLLDERGDEKYLVVLISADKGLAGAFNANVIKATQAFLNENAAKSDRSMIAVGRKGRDFFKRRDVEITDEYIGLTGTRPGQLRGRQSTSPTSSSRRFTDDTTIDKVFVVFTEFKTVLSQRPVIEQLLPIPRGRSRRGRNRRAGRIHLRAAGRRDLRQAAAEADRTRRSTKACSSRSLPIMARSMTAMDSASKNAGELIDTLTLNMNRDPPGRDH